MNARSEFQILLGEDGKPAFVVVPYQQFQRMRGGLHHGGVPNEVVNHVFDHGVSPMAAWRAGHCFSAAGNTQPMIT